MAHPALFRLMFASGRPAHASPELAQAANAAYDQLEADVARLKPPMPAMEDVVTVWTLTHGLADLLIAGRLKSLSEMRRAEREAALSGILRAAFTDMAARKRSGSPTRKPVCD
jgi:hypothetical protein